MLYINICIINDDYVSIEISYLMIMLRDFASVDDNTDIINRSFAQTHLMTSTEKNSRKFLRSS